MLNEKEKLNEIIQLGYEITPGTGPGYPAGTYPQQSKDFHRGRRGLLYIVDGGKLKFQCNQNDTLQKKLAPGKKLIYSTFTVPIDNKTISGYVANNGEMLNIPDVYAIPERAPYTFGVQYDDLSKYHTTSMLTVPLKSNRGTVVGVLQLINAKDQKGEAVLFLRTTSRSSSILPAAPPWRSSAPR